MNDYEKLLLNYEDKNKLVQLMFTQYQNLIYKKANAYSRWFQGKLDRDDFVSDIYLKLYYYAEYIKLEKIKEPAKFSFHIFVTNAINDVLTVTVKKYKKEAYSIDALEDSPFEAPSEHIVTRMDISTFRSTLTPLQLKCLELREEGKTCTEIQKELKLSYWIVSTQFKKMRVKYSQIIA